MIKLTYAQIYIFIRIKTSTVCLVITVFSMFVNNINKHVWLSDFMETTTEFEGHTY